MNNDAVIIESLRQAFRSSSAQFCRAYNDFSGNDSGETILSVLDGQLRIAKKLASLESNFIAEKNENAVLADIHEFLDKEKK